jgi:hypothetical protein
MPKKKWGELAGMIRAQAPNARTLADVGAALGIGPDDEVDIPDNAPVLTGQAAHIGAGGKKSPAVANLPPEVRAMLESAQADAAEARRMLKEREEQAARDARAAQEQAVRDRADAFAAKAVKEGKALPAEADALKKVHAVAGMDDLDRPIEGFSRAAALERSVEARGRHALLGERLGAGVAALDNQAASGEEDLKEWARKENEAIFGKPRPAAAR